MKNELPEENEYKRVKIQFVTGHSVEFKKLKGNIELTNDGVKISQMVKEDGYYFEDVGYYPNSEIVSVGYLRNTRMVE